MLATLQLGIMNTGLLSGMFTRLSFKYGKTGDIRKMRTQIVNLIRIKS